MKSCSRRNFLLLLGVLVSTFILFAVLYDPVNLEPFREFRQSTNFEKLRNVTRSVSSTNTTLSENPVDALNSNVRVFCWIMSQPKNTDTKATAVNQTWLKRCDGGIFVTVNADSKLPQIPGSENIPEGYDKLWHKTRAAFEWIYKNKISDYDWFLKADDDTYFIIDNLKLLLLNYNPDDPLYLGCKFRMYDPKRYMSGGAGYVLSRKALELLGSKGFPDEKICHPADDGFYEDVEIGRCMKNLNVTAVDTRDYQLRHRMLPMSLPYHLGGRPKTKWLNMYMAFPYQNGKEMLSDYVVSFHYMTPNIMYILDHALYNIRHIGDQSSLLNDALAASENENITMLETLRNLSDKINS